MESETWMAIAGFEGRYEVSSFGGVRSLDATDPIRTATGIVQRERSGRVLKPFVCKGHHYVNLGRASRIAVHRLVLETFVGPAPEGCETLHKDGNPTNNHLSNLRWGTDSENLLDSVRHGSLPQGERHHYAKLRESTVVEIIGLIRTQPTKVVAERFGVAARTIRDISNGKTWKSISRPADSGACA